MHGSHDPATCFGLARNPDGLDQKFLNLPLQAFKIVCFQAWLLEQVVLLRHQTLPQLLQDRVFVRKVAVQGWGRQARAFADHIGRKLFEPDLLQQIGSSGQNLLKSLPTARLIGRRASCRLGFHEIGHDGITLH